jgi:hypothetical protein
MEEQRLRVLEKRMLRRMYGHRREEITGDGNKFLVWSLIGPINRAYYSPDIVACLLKAKARC